MSYVRKALFCSAILVSAGAVRRMVTHEVILPVPFSALAAATAALWIGYVIFRVRDDILRRFDQQKKMEQQKKDDTAALMLAAFDVQSAQRPALHRVK